jgi:glycosyltransferase involved in cell wall biosynthesis
MAMTAKPIILVFVGYYRPGFKAGGILRSIENLVDHLHDEFQFKIVTRNHDLGETKPYPDVRHREWQSVGNALVYYLAESDESLQEIRRIVKETPHDLIYLNSFFEPLTIKVLVNRRLGQTQAAPIVVAPRGEFGWASLRLKYPKKLVFMAFARMVGLYEGAVWHASSEVESNDISRVMRIPATVVRVALNLPIASDRKSRDTAPVELAAPTRGLRVVFLARVSPEKNLDFALRVLSQVRAPVSFDICGPIDNDAYWHMCEELIRQVPNHVLVRYAGTIKPEQIMSTLAQYDLMLFPSGGENYAHVIAEALTCGTQVLTSTHTPWRNLESRGLGWDLPLDRPQAFIHVIDTIATEGEQQRLERRRIIKKKAKDLLDDPRVVDANRQLFVSLLNAS